MRRATVPPSCILALSVFCGVQAVGPAYKGPGNVATIIAMVWLLAVLVNMSARNQWRSLRSLPRPKWGAAEVGLACVAVGVGGVIGPQFIARHAGSGLPSWGLGGAVALIVASCMLAANASYQRRSARMWQG
jgi:threonine/homoserine/homoserine lactone efflux protein